MADQTPFTSRRAVVVGATSGLGHEVAQLLVAKGWQVGIAARSEAKLVAMEEAHPGRVVHEVIDVNSESAPEKLMSLIGRLGGMDLYFHASGIGSQNPTLQPGIELATVATNCTGFARMVGEAYRHFVLQGGGHLCAISSIAGTKGLGPAPSYSASKAFQSTYLEALEQQSVGHGYGVRITDIRPGFVDTPLLAGGKYPMLLDAKVTARAIVRAVTKKRRVVVLDWRWRIVTAAWRLIPRCMWRHML